MIGVFADFEPDSTTSDRTDDPMDVLRIEAIEQHEKPTVLVTKTSVKLNGQAMGLFADEVVIMNGDPLTGYQLVRYQHDVVV